MRGDPRTCGTQAPGHGLRSIHLTPRAWTMTQQCPLGHTSGGGSHGPAPTGSDPSAEVTPGHSTSQRTLHTWGVILGSRTEDFLTSRCAYTEVSGVRPLNLIPARQALPRRTQAEHREQSEVQAQVSAGSHSAPGLPLQPRKPWTSGSDTELPGTTASQCNVLTTVKVKLLQGTLRDAESVQELESGDGYTILSMY